MLSLVAESMLARDYSNETLLRFAFTDFLTGLKTRGYFEQQLDLELARAERRGTPVAVLMIDIDHFKRLNDTHGHPAGDIVLRDVAAILTRELREIDTAARYGGEEFILLLPETDLAGRKTGRPAPALLRRAGQLFIGAADGAPEPSASPSASASPSSPRRPASNETCSKPPMPLSIRPKPRDATASSSTPTSRAKRKPRKQVGFRSQAFKVAGAQSLHSCLLATRLGPATLTQPSRLSTGRAVFAGACSWPERPSPPRLHLLRSRCCQPSRVACFHRRAFAGAQLSLAAALAGCTFSGPLCRPTCHGLGAARFARPSPGLCVGGGGNCAAAPWPWAKPPSGSASEFSPPTAPSWRSSTCRMASIGAGFPVQISNCRAAWCTNISAPLIVPQPFDCASFSSGVSIGLYTESKTHSRVQLVFLQRSLLVRAHPHRGRIEDQVEAQLRQPRCASPSSTPDCLASACAVAGVRFRMDTSAPLARSPNTAARAAPPAPSTSTRAPCRATRGSMAATMPYTSVLNPNSLPSLPRTMVLQAPVCWVSTSLLSRCSTIACL